MKKLIYVFFIGLLAFSCRNTNSNQTIDNTIYLTLTCGDGVDISGNAKIKFNKGVSWKVAKSEVEKKVSYIDNYIHKAYHLDNSNGKELKEDDIFDKDTTIFIESIKDKWVKVKYSELEDYLSNKAKAGEINYIWLIEVEAENLQGGKAGMQPKASDLGNILKSKPSVKVALKFDEKIEDLKKMNATFVQCTDLVAIENIPVGVENLEMCFAGCSLLEEVNNIPNTVTSLKNCFNKCTSLKKAPSIPLGVKDMSDCFAFCSELETPPALPKTVVNLEECFLNCAKLKKAPKIPENVTNLATTFMMTDLEEMPEIPNKVENIKFCFAGCRSLTKTKSIPASVKDMRNTFMGCEKITSITLNCKYNNEKGGAAPEREGYFFESAFMGCTGLKENSITVPSAYLEDYKKGATSMGIAENCFIGK